jgi:hypothetical protein
MKFTEYCFAQSPVAHSFLVLSYNLQGLSEASSRGLHQISTYVPTLTKTDMALLTYLSHNRLISPVFEEIVFLSWVLRQSSG